MHYLHHHKSPILVVPNPWEACPATRMRKPAIQCPFRKFSPPRSKRRVRSTLSGLHSPCSVVPYVQYGVRRMKSVVFLRAWGPGRWTPRVTGTRCRAPSAGSGAPVDSWHVIGPEGLWLCWELRARCPVVSTSGYKWLWNHSRDGRGLLAYRYTVTTVMRNTRLHVYGSSKKGRRTIQPRLFDDGKRAGIERMTKAECPAGCALKHSGLTS